MGRIEGLLEEVTEAELREERQALLAERQRIDQKLSLVDAMLDFKRGATEEASGRRSLPPLATVVTALFRENPEKARGTDEVFNELDARGLLGGRNKASVNAALSRLFSNGTLRRPQHGLYLLVSDRAEQQGDSSTAGESDAVFSLHLPERASDDIPF